MNKLYQQLVSAKKNQQKLLAILIDPDKTTPDEIKKTAKKIKKIRPDWILTGGSLVSKNHLNKLIKKLRKHLDIPIILFPGNPAQISYKADGILFLSLISGRNPEYLIGNQVIAAPLLYHSGMDIISTGYILIENGHSTSVSYISNTLPVPRDKTDIALATALAGEMLGLKTIYLEAGSGAKKPVPYQMIQTIARNIKIPLIVGGGIKSKEEILKMWHAGADMVVVGTAFENGEFKVL
jgi:putative glycerol-1-phosphate prenyltransferase